MNTENKTDRNKAEQAFVQAENLLNQGCLNQAGLYLSYGLHKAPGHWDLLQRYQQNVLNYCHQLTEKNEFESTLNILTDMETFLRAQVLELELSDLDQLNQILIEIEQYKQWVSEKMIAAQLVETSQQLKTKLAHCEVLLAHRPSSPNLEAIYQYLNELKSHLSHLQTIDQTLVTETESVEITDKVKQLKSTMTSFEQQLATIQSATTVSTMIQRTEQFIEQAQTEPLQSEFVLYYLTAAESLTRQIVLMASETEVIKTQITALLQKLNDAKEKIAQRQSQTVWNEIELILNQIQIDEQSSAQQAIVQWSQLRQILGDKANKLSSFEFLNKAQTLMDRVNNEINQWQQTQLQRYEQWAIKRIGEFYKRYQGELKMFSNKTIIYKNMLSYFGEIETKYLSVPASTAYHEVFNLFYAKLDQEQKVSLSAKMTLNQKKALTDF